jgi:K+/H+ antiporter YhaU regulatory subunit KhtT
VTDDDDDRKSEEKKREEDETASQAPQILEANFSSSSTAKTASGLDSLFQKQFPECRWCAVRVRR